MKIHRSSKLAMLLVIMLGTGCSEPGVDGVHVWGNATWRGQPIPNGTIVFTPDIAKGNSGHQSWATITDGRFDTRSQGKIVAKGASTAMIRGSQKSTNPAYPSGTELVLRHTLAVEIPTQSGELNIDIPPSIEQIVSMPEGQE